MSQGSINKLIQHFRDVAEEVGFVADVLVDVIDKFFYANGEITIRIRNGNLLVNFVCVDEIVETDNN